MQTGFICSALTLNLNESLPPGEAQLANYPGLTRGLVAVLLFYDGQRSLVTALRALTQAREGRTWTVGVSMEMQVSQQCVTGNPIFYFLVFRKTFLNVIALTKNS